MNKPNILWLMAEDMCPNLGCYGDIDAFTPNLDKLAKEGIRYENCSSVAPVCSAARTTLALGLYPPTAGVGNHRSHVAIPENIEIFSKYLQDQNYYTAINKTDYNFVERYNGDMIRGWDTVLDVNYALDTIDITNKMSEKWNNRPEGKPFFFQNTYAVTHQSRYGYPNNATLHRETFIPRTRSEDYRDRSKLTIPSYHPDTPDIREVWGQYHECITAMDRMVGETINKLKEDGLYEETIIFFFGDNGMGMPQGKFNMWDEGTRVPLIVRVPQKYQHMVKGYTAGKVEYGGVDFIDITTATLALGGAEIPEHIQGRDFLNLRDNEVKDENYSYRNRIDNSCEVVRSVRDSNYIYIRNFYPQKGWRYAAYSATESPWMNISMEVEAKKEYTLNSDINRKNAYFMPRKPIEELYDIKKDPDQMNNLAGEEEQQERLLKMRDKLKTWMLEICDGGLLTEQEMRKQAKKLGLTAYEVIRDKKINPLEEIIKVCDKMFDDNLSVESFFQDLESENGTIRYWAIQGIHTKADFKKETIDVLIKALNDESEMVQLAAAEALADWGKDDKGSALAKDKIIEFLNNKDDVMLPLEAIDCLDRLGKKVSEAFPLTEGLMKIDQISDEADSERYRQAVVTVARFISEKYRLHHDYSELDEQTKERLLVIRELREQNDLLDLAIM